MNYDETWIGVGVKSGGMVGLMGYESTTGWLVNLGNPNIRYKFAIKSWREGIGLGGGGNVVVFLVFKLAGAKWLDDLFVSDWGCNISLGENYWQVLKFLADKSFFRTAKLLLTSVNYAFCHLEDFRTAASFLYNCYDFDGRTDHPRLFFDVPMTGVGVEVSLFKSEGRFSLID